MKHKLKEQDIVIIHDAARPLVSQGMIDACYTNCDGFDGAMPVLPAKDTYYLSSDGTHITSLLKRNELFAGQAPESFVFGKYYEVHKKMSYEELKQINGSSEIAYLCGLQIKMFPGDEKNFKITTQADIENFKRILQGV
jgi:2-C-methyl-D-erythritol 4-phosphate cytidylyltransferase